MKTSIVLSGGGVKGSWQMGCLLGLRAQGKLDGVSTVYGTSVGSINAALFAMAPSQMEKLWLGVKGRSDVLAFNWSNLLLWADGIFHTGPMQKSLVGYCTEETSVEAVACYCDMTDGSIQYASNKKMPKADFMKFVAASSAIPFAMSPVDGKLVDGGTREQSPLSQAIKDGADKIVVVLCNPWEPNESDVWQPPKGFLKSISVGLRAIDMMEHEVMLNDIQVCKSKNDDPSYRKIDVSIYCPDRVWMDTLDFTPAKIQAALAAGKADSTKPPLTLDQI